MTVPAASSSMTPPADGRSEWKTVSVAIASYSAVGLDQGAQVEVGEVVGVAGQEHLLPVDPVPVGGERARAAEQFRLEDRAHRRRPGPPGYVVTNRIGQVVEVDQDLLDACRIERVEPDIDQGPAVDGHHALRDGVGDRPQAAAHARGEEKSLHVSAFRTTPSARIRALAWAST